MSMLHSRELPLSLWAEAANTAVFVWNRTVNRQLSDITPFEVMFNQIPDVSYFRTFGSDAYLHVPKKQRTKLAAKSQKLVLVGYDQQGRAYRLWNPITKRICVGVDVIINETLGVTSNISNCTESPTEDGTVYLHLPTAATTTPTNLPTSIDIPSVNMADLSDNTHPNLPDPILPDQFTNEAIYDKANSTPVQTIDMQTIPIQDDIIALSQGEIVEPILEALSQGEIVEPVLEATTTYQQGETALPIQHEPPHITTTATGSTSFSNTSTAENRGGNSTVLDEHSTKSSRRPRSRQPPIRYGEWVRYDNNKSKDASTAYIATQTTRIPEPKTYKEAMTSPHASQWKEAMAKEFASLTANKTWVLKPLPEGRKAIKCKWIYKVKYKPSGEVKRFKARLVAKGYSQVVGIDFTETYAPIIKYDVVRAIFVISNAHGMCKAQFDVLQPISMRTLSTLFSWSSQRVLKILTGHFMFVFYSKAYMVSNKVLDVGIRHSTNSLNSLTLYPM